MAQVLIVSNRLPVSVTKEHGELVYSFSLGGVATGLSSYINSRRNRWIGWPGIASEDLTERDKNAITVELAKRNCVPVFLTKRQVEDFYNGYSNSLLWPLFHNLKLSDGPNHERWWKAYKEVNKAFAETTLNIAQPSSTIWVQDYQLMLLPELLKTERPNNHIGFFFHIPFVEAKNFSKLPETHRLLQGMLGSDLIGFHTKDYVKNFMATCQEYGLGISTEGQFIVGNRTVRVTDFPMGIDYEKFAQSSKIPEVKAAVKRYKKQYKGQRLIAAVDRLDISKGFVERLVAYREFLTQNPKILGKVTFVLVGAPSRTEIEAYQKLSKRVEKLASEINAAFGTAKWQPLDYINHAIPFEEVTALFQVADIAFIAPLRDGMNLVAKEFIASKHNNGILILSDTAGAAQELQDALLVNHKKPDTLVTALEQAMSMRKREVRSRLHRMQKQLSVNTVQAWSGNFMKNLQRPIPGTARTRTLSIKFELALRNSFQTANKRLLLLDYDGSLVPFVDDFTDAKPSKKLYDMLQKLASDPKNDVVVISGRSSKDLDDWFGDMHIHLVAEHGAMVKQAGHKTWKTLERAESSWKKLVLPVLEKYSALTPGSRIEIKPHSLVWHYRQSPAYYAQKYAVVIKRSLKPYLKSHGLELFQGNKILEVKNPSINKGAAVKVWLERDYDFILALGDDYTDEDMFAILPPHGISIKVGHGRSAAHYRLHSSADVQSLIQKLVKK